MAIARFANPHYEPQSIAAREALRERKLKSAMAWLDAVLPDWRAHRAVDVLAAGVAAGHATRTLQRASEVPGVQKERQRPKGKLSAWQWTPRTLTRAQ
jgi:hypothetical protein